MQNDNDPFAFSPDPNRTVIMPTPGGRRRGGAAAVIPPSPLIDAPLAFDEKPFDSADLTPASAASVNPLMRAASPLFALVRHLRSVRDHADVATLRADVIEAIRRFQADTRSAGVDPKTAAQASYALCALIDETVLGTPWGLQSVWSEQGLLITFYREAKAGEIFFNFLKRGMENPRDYIDILEFFYVCLSLGFQGKFRVEPGGVDRLNQLRGQLYTVIARQRGTPDPSLSVRWRGVEDKSPKMARLVPLWVTGVGAFALLLIAFLGYSFSLNSRSDAVYGRIAALVPLTARVRQEVQPLAPPLLIERLRITLAEEISRHLVDVQASGGSARIIVFNRGLFPSGGAEVGPQAVPLIRKIGLFLADQSGPIQIVGHTDNLPIRSLRFPSNWHLAKARADAVAALLAPPLRPDQLHVEGRADTEPLESNENAEGRNQNRRVEISLPLS